MPWRDSLTVARREPETSRRRAEAAQVADAIAELVAREGVAPGDVMVLARQRSRLALVADALAARRLPCVMPEALDLGASPDALDLAAVLDVLASPGHDLSLARALKSPLFGAGDDALLWLARQARGRSWLDTLLAAEPEDAALARARTLLARWQVAARTLPPHDLLDRVVHEGDLLPRLAAVVPPARLPEAQHALRSLLAAALEQDGGRYASLYGLVRELRAGRLRAPGAVPAGAVQLLTVHGAKGLEARAVFVVDAEPEKRPADRASLLVDWPVDRSAPARLAFVASTSRVPPSLAGLWQEEEAARDREELNGLYVAMTRAREWLVFSRTEPRVAAAHSWWRRVAPQLAPWTPTAPEAAAARAPVRIAVQAAPRRRPPVPPPPADVTDAAAARLGQAVHRALEWLGRPGAALAPAEAAQAAAAAFDADPGRVHEVVERIWTAPALARFFGGPALLWSGNEVAFADAEGLMRLDRLVQLREGDAAPRWWVIDFKLGTEAAALVRYAPQMARYLAAVRRAQPGAEVRGGFITGDGRFVESAPN